MIVYEVDEVGEEEHITAGIFSDHETAEKTRQLASEKARYGDVGMKGESISSCMDERFTTQSTRCGQRT
ncbi:MAG: hypothetical protein WC057_04675 [Dehalococcoidales bacterium]|jgi:hypothetical protein